MAIENVRIVYSIEDSEIDTLLSKFSKLTKEEQEQVRLMQQMERQTSQTVSNQNTQYNGLNKTIGNIRNTIIAAFAVDKILSFGKEVIETAKRMESLNNAIKFASGSQLEYQKNTAFLIETSKRLGVNLEVATNGYKTILASAKPAGIESEKTREIFEGVAIAASAMGLSAEDQQGTFLALGQILSKGTVQAEELRGQIGERIPGAFNLAAQALNVTTAQLNKMLEQGQVLSNDFVPKFAAKLKEQFSPALKDSANSLTAVSARAENAYASLKLAFGQVGQDAYKGTLVVITNVLEGLAKLVSGNQKVKTSTEQSIEAITSERKELNDLVASIRNQNVSNETRDILVSELNKKFPEFAKTIDVVKASEKDLEVAMKAVNRQFDLQIYNVAKQGIVKEFQEERNRLIQEELALLKSLQRAREAGATGVGGVDFLEKEIQIRRGKAKFLQDAEEARLFDLRKNLENLGLSEKEANERAIKDSAKNSSDKVVIDKKMQDELAKQQSDFALRELEAQQRLAQEKIKNQIELNNLIIANENTTNTEKIEITRANQNLESELIALQNAQKKNQYEIDKNNIIQVKKLTKTEVLAIDTETAQQQLLLDKKTRAELQKLQIKTIDNTKSLEYDLQKELDKSWESYYSKHKKNEEDRLKELERQKEKERQIRQAVYDTAVSLTNSFFQIGQNNLEKESQNLQSQKDYELQLAQGNELGVPEISEYGIVAPVVNFLLASVFTY